MILFCFLVIKRLDIREIESGEATDDVVSELTRTFLIDFFTFYSVYFDFTKRSLPFLPRIHIYDTHSIDVNGNTSDSGSDASFDVSETGSQDTCNANVNAHTRSIHQEIAQALERMQSRALDTMEDSESPSDILTILNPAPPYTNSVYNLTMSSVRAIHGECKRAVRILSESANKQRKWERLLHRVEFFGENERFIIIEVACHTGTSQQTVKTFESQLKHFLYHAEHELSDYELRMLPGNIEAHVCDADSVSHSLFLDDKDVEENTQYFRYAIAIIGKVEEHEDIDLTSSAQFLRYAFERNNENISFRTKCVSRKVLRSFYRL